MRQGLTFYTLGRNECIPLLACSAKQ